MIGPSQASEGRFPADIVVEARTTQRQATVLVRGPVPAGPPGWEAHEPTLEELALAHLRASRPSAATTGSAKTTTEVAA